MHKPTATSERKMLGVSICGLWSVEVNCARLPQSTITKSWTYSLSKSLQSYSTIFLEIYKQNYFRVTGPDFGLLHS